MVQICTRITRAPLAVCIVTTTAVLVRYMCNAVLDRQAFARLAPQESTKSFPAHMDAPNAEVADMPLLLVCLSAPNVLRESTRPPLVAVPVNSAITIARRVNTTQGVQAVAQAHASCVALVTLKHWQALQVVTNAQQANSTKPRDKRSARTVLQTSTSFLLVRRHVMARVTITVLRVIST